MHQFDPHAAPDSDFVPGTLDLVVVGNRGRFLDPRRTPASIVGVDADTGQFHARIDGFEDRGAVWELPFESIDGMQFEIASRRAPAADVERLADAVRRFDRRTAIAVDPGAAAETSRTLARLTGDALAWLREGSEFLRASPTLAAVALDGAPALTRDLRRFLGERGVWDVEDAFATRYVSNPRSGDLVKAHRIVMAELGLVPYEGKVLRDERAFDAPLGRARRAEHVLLRLAFVRALFAALETRTLVLYRGLCCDGAPTQPPNETFVSTSWSFDVARSCAGEREVGKTGMILRQPVPVERVFMTHLETSHMHRQFREAEAVLLWEAGNPVF